MKKIITMILCVCLAASAVVAVASQGNDVETIVGLQEKMDNLWLVNHFTQEQMDDMYQQAVDGFIRDFWSMPWEQRKMTEWRGIKYPDDPQKELEYRLSKYNPNLTRGLLVSYMNTETMKYFNEYAQSGNFIYLFNGEANFQANAGDYTLEGQYIDVNYRTRSSLSLEQEGIDFLKNIEGISDMLRDAGETVVNDVKLFSNGAMFLYLNCGNGEYLVRLFGQGEGVNEFIPQFKQYQVYPLADVIQAVADHYKNHQTEWNPNNNISRRADAAKPIFTAEAEALQQAGLLNGNEKGLDLLKPLTRIEAAAMLLRALGEPETPPQSGAQVFSDVPATHWGFGAAAQAYDLGLIKGVGEGEFAPDKIMAANEFATMTLRAADEPEFDWQQALNLLVERGIITQENAATMDLFTRGDMAKIIYEARQKSLF